MSSPLASLDKNKRRGFHATQRPVPFKVIKDEDAILEEIITLELNSMDKSKYVKENNDLSDKKLMGHMIAKITHLEKQLVVQQKEISEKDSLIAVQSQKIEILRNAATENNDDTRSTLELERQLHEAKLQILEMENFLKDYGMTWVGSTCDENSVTYINDPISPENKVWQRNESVIGSDFCPDYDLIMKNIEELNLLTNEGETEIQHTLNGAQLKVIEPISLCLYKNGILMFDGPFRSFDDETTRICLQDIMDGYFPSELQSRYPNGIPIAFKDQRYVTYRKNSRIAFTGQGQILCSNNTTSSSVDDSMSDLASHGISDIAINENKVYSPKEMGVFLNKLPNSVIKNGKIVEIRSDIKKELKLCDSTNVQETNFQTEDSNYATEPDVSSSDRVTTLRIKSETGNSEVIIKMKPSQTIGDLRRRIDKKKLKKNTKYNIISSFPRKIHDDNSLTLSECGLTPNATLHLKSIT